MHTLYHHSTCSTSYATNSTYFAYNVVMEERMTRTDRSLTLRIPDDLYQWLTEWAAKNDRSINGQVLNLLRQARAADEDKSEA